MYRQPVEPAKTVARLIGMHDRSEADWRRQESLQEKLAQLLGGYGYRRLETPMLEPTELFMRKSGGELASQLYSFTDAGSTAVSLRPEFTSPIMRHYLERAGEVDLPARWQYCGPVFRFDGDASNECNNSGQFTQVGGELIGASSLMADVELLSLAVAIPVAAGLRDWRLQLADLDVLNSLLDTVGLSDRARSFIVQNVPRLRTGLGAVPALLEQGRHLHLAGDNGDDDYLRQAVTGLDDAQARVVLMGLLRWNAADQLGQRTPEEVVDRIIRKIQSIDDEPKLRLGLELASDLAVVTGEPAEALGKAEAVLKKAGADQSAIDRLTEIFHLLADLPDIAGHITLDFGLVRGLAYYNGIIFEVSHPDWAGALGGGGRYDALARALGGKDLLPALGFAYNLDALLLLTGNANAPVTEKNVSSLVMSDVGAGHHETLQAAQELREQDQTAELEVGGRSVDEAKAFAAKRGLGRVVVVGKGGQRTTHEV